MNIVRSIFEQGYVRMDGVWYDRDFSNSPGEIQGKEPSAVEYLLREGYSILYHEGRVYLKKAEIGDLETLKSLGVIPQDFETSGISDGPAWLPSGYVKYSSNQVFERVAEARDQKGIKELSTPTVTGASDDDPISDRLT